jgi:hypothetical protein
LIGNGAVSDRNFEYKETVNNKAPDVGNSQVMMNIDY